MGIDSIIYDEINYADGIIYGMNKKLSKWGMCQVVGEITNLLIPIKYDSISNLGNESFCLVWNNKKVGIYISPFSDREAGESVPCIYDEAKTEKNVVIVRKNAKWGKINPSTGEIIGELIYDSFEAVLKEP